MSDTTTCHCRSRNTRIASATEAAALAYAPQRLSTVPADLEQELASRPDAREFFANLSSQNRYAILYRLHDAKRPETRERRLNQFVSMLRERKTIHP